MARFKVHKDRDFTVLSNEVIRNSKMSLKAKGLLALLLSLPDDWEFSVRGLATLTSDKTDAISSALNELEQHGHLVRSRVRGGLGRFGGAQYDIYQEPIAVGENVPVSDKPIQDNPVQDNPVQDNPVQVNPVQDLPSEGEPVLDFSPQQSKNEQNIKEENKDLQKSFCLTDTRTRANVRPLEDEIMSIIKRPLTVRERGTCVEWAQHKDPELIIVAVRDNLFRGDKFSFDYVEDTLNKWELNNVTSVNAANNWILEHHVENLKEHIHDLYDSEDDRYRALGKNRLYVLLSIRDGIIELFNAKRYEAMLSTFNSYHDVMKYLPENIQTYIRTNYSKQELK